MDNYMRMNLSEKIVKRLKEEKIIINNESEIEELISKTIKEWFEDFYLKGKL